MSNVGTLVSCTDARKRGNFLERYKTTFGSSLKKLYNDLDIIKKYKVFYISLIKSSA